MAGIYIHIPFCAKICHYCDFYKIRDLSHIPRVIEKVQEELVARKNYLGNDEVESIYFGGGTPTLLSHDQIQDIIETIHHHYLVARNNEITLEANPEDLTQGYLQQLKLTDINRLSIGCQTFSNQYLTLLNRRHDKDQAIRSVILAQEAGYHNVSIDLIYGLPGMGLKQWEEMVQVALGLPVQHLSAYHLTIEENTVFARWLKQGKIKMPEEEISRSQYLYLTEYGSKCGFEHYEISSFAKDGKYSRHNMLYWQQKKYLGVGPSAHSYDESSRRWNENNVAEYIQGVEHNHAYFEEESLDDKKKFNEYIMTRLRTKWGIYLPEIPTVSGEKVNEVFQKKISRYLNDNIIVKEGENIRLSDKGMFISDFIIADLFLL